MQMVVIDDNDHERGIVLTEEQKRRRRARSPWRASRCARPGPSLPLPLLDASARCRSGPPVPTVSAPST